MGAEVLPIICLAIESPTHALVDSAMRSLPVILPVLDFSTIKNELFPVIAHVFSKTSSLGIKVRGLEAFVILAGGSLDDNLNNDDGLDGLTKDGKKKAAASALDKYTIQEKMVPLVRAIKTKEPAVMIAALKVMRQIGNVVDTEYLAMDVLPILWNMSLGPLLNLQQFQSFIALIKLLSTRVETEHTKKLQEMGGNNATQNNGDDIMSFGNMPSAFSATNGSSSNDANADFERLVLGKVTSAPVTALDNSWDTIPNQSAASNPRQTTATTQPSFSWSTPPSHPTSTSRLAQPPPNRNTAPSLTQIPSITPTQTQFSIPLQPKPSPSFAPPQSLPPLQPQSSGINWSAAMPAQNNWSKPSTPSQNAFSNMSSMNHSLNSLSMAQTQQQQSRPTLSSLSSFSLPPPPISPNPPVAGYAAGAPAQQPTQPFGLGNGFGMQNGVGGSQAKNGLDKWESLL